MLQVYCNDLIVLHLGYLDYPRYMITVHFFNLEDMKADIVDVEFEVTIQIIYLIDDLL